MVALEKLERSNLWLLTYSSSKSTFYYTLFLIFEDACVKSLSLFVSDYLLTTGTWYPETCLLGSLFTS